MTNQREAVSRRFSDPDFQGRIMQTSLGLNLFMAALVAVFVIHDTYVWLNPPKRLIIISDGKGATRPVMPVDAPIVDEVEVLNWTVSSVLAAYNINYHDYREQFGQAGRRFTYAAWNSFAESYINTKNLDEIKQSRLLCYAQAERAAVVTDSSLKSGHLAYTIQFPMVLTCQNVREENTQHVVVTVGVIRTEADDHPEGLAIDQLVATRR